MTEKNFDRLVGGEWYRLSNNDIGRCTTPYNGLDYYEFYIGGQGYFPNGKHATNLYLDAIEHIKVTIEPMPMPKKKVVKAPFYYQGSSGTLLSVVAMTKEKAEDEYGKRLLRWPAFPGSEIEVDCDE